MKNKSMKFRRHLAGEIIAGKKPDIVVVSGRIIVCFCSLEEMEEKNCGFEEKKDNSITEPQKCRDGQKITKRQFVLGTI